LTLASIFELVVMIAGIVGVTFTVVVLLIETYSWPGSTCSPGL
jgi:hypothetical protein